MKWISVKDRFPESSEDVLLFIASHKNQPPSHKAGIVIGDYYEPWGKFRYQWERYGEVTHWMSLPETPDKSHHAKCFTRECQEEYERKSSASTICDVMWNYYCVDECPLKDKK